MLQPPAGACPEPQNLWAAKRVLARAYAAMCGASERLSACEAAAGSSQFAAILASPQVERHFNSIPHPSAQQHQDPCRHVSTLTPYPNTICTDPRVHPGMAQRRGHAAAGSRQLAGFAQAPLRIRSRLDGRGVLVLKLADLSRAAP